MLARGRIAPVAGLLFLLTLVMFVDILVAPSSTILSRQGTDLSQLYVHLRAFCFGQLSQGRLPLWNPHLFSGTPCLGGFQSAMLYPPNWLYLLLPLDRAINLGIVLHVYLLGLFTYLWAERRGLRRSSGLLVAVLAMFCGPHFLHIYAGHLSNLCAMPWVPLIFLAVDGLIGTGSFRWCLVGAVAVAMQVLAGHPQYVFYTGIAAGIYAAWNIAGCQHRASLVLGLMALYLGGAALSAAQLLPGLAAGAESVRGAGMPYDMARMGSLPPENLLTLVVPGFFGTEFGVPGGSLYWGRNYLWEVSLYFGVSGLVLALCGLRLTEARLRRSCLGTAVCLLILALGSHTPLFGLLYRCVPGFDRFRGTAKFVFPAALFLIMLAGTGFDRLLSGRGRARLAPILSLGCGLAMLGLSLAIWTCRQDQPELSWWSRLMQAEAGTGEGYLAVQHYQNVAFIAQAAAAAARRTAMAGGVFLLAAALLYLGRRSPRWMYLLGLLAAIETLVYARSSLATFNLALVREAAGQNVAADASGDYRVLDMVRPNAATSEDTFTIWGDDPGVSRRYAEFIAFTQGEDPDQVTQYADFHKPHRLWRMLRCRYILSKAGGRDEMGRPLVKRESLTEPLPRATLVTDYQLAHGRDAVLAAMFPSSFDPGQQVILESPPDPPPVRSSEPGTVEIVDESTESLTIHTRADAPAILLITDGYASGWRADPLPGSVQTRYEVLPADYCLRAIPLQAGEHRLRLQYAPEGFRVGGWISVVSLFGYGALLIIGRRRGGRTPQPIPVGPHVDQS